MGGRHGAENRDTPGLVRVPCGTAWIAIFATAAQSGQYPPGLVEVRPVGAWVWIFGVVVTFGDEGVERDGRLPERKTESVPPFVATFPRVPQFLVGR